MPRLNPAQLVLSALCAVLTVFLGYLLFAPLPDVAVPQIRSRGADPVDETPLARFDAPGKQAFAEVDERSVFNPLRVRVSGPVQPGASGATSLPADLSLVGVILDDDTKLALFKSPAAPLAVGVPVGGNIEGWEVTRIDPDMVALRAGGPEQEMRLSANKAPATSPNPPRVFGPPNFPRAPNFVRNNPNPNANGNGNNNSDSSDDNDDNN